MCKKLTIRGLKREVSPELEQFFLKAHLGDGNLGKDPARHLGHDILHPDIVIRMNDIELGIE